ncbi:MAG TPA: DUF4389 domain-containing protein [Pseudomonadales bacterium]|nr:DUF4389 domain-containing protein [Pseudomonadales bacterium]
MDDDIKASLTASESWARGVYMLLFAVAYWVAGTVLFAVTIIQFIFLLVGGRANDRLAELGDDLSVYYYQVIQFLTFNSEQKPFPFNPWPSGDSAPWDDDPVTVSQDTDDEEDEKAPH